MFAKSSILFALFAASAQLAAATPPACLLAAIGHQPNPADLPTICGVKASDVESDLKSDCASGTYSAALSAFSSVCQAHGLTVSATSSAASSTAASSTGASSVSASTTGSSLASSPAVTGTGSADATVTSAPYPTGNSSVPTTVVVLTSTFYDTNCGCTKTSELTESTGASYGASSGFLSSGYAAPTCGSGSGSGNNATIPSTPSATTSGSSPEYTGAAAKTNVGSFAAAAILAAGVVIAL
ncbi:hypothetical protein L228DRAFT_266177 [Xylona heveae TC161]|uniref:Extracellular membrane protein CFEM domain-containing protein n=1 Tax=Xylona heveae (strain CBS 132557 / TC161) TaxID=1328760 RepID=A0A165J4K1_XYLHT|nr:hypothetical protein L228DRAFT_266177 [Xylona heveae TC161]KZF25722.1 hypothetical protein L228DRAFT_266177 [Xylona heveae TC161]